MSIASRATTVLGALLVLGSLGAPVAQAAGPTGPTRVDTATGPLGTYTSHGQELRFLE